MKRWERLIIGGIAAAGFLIVWELAMPMGWVKTVNVSRPSLVVQALRAIMGDQAFTTHVAVSLREFLIGFLLSAVVGVPFGVLIGRYRVLGMLLDPLITAVYTLPRMAILPVLMVWFGVAGGATTAVVFLSSVFPILVNAAVGVREVDPSWVKAVRSFGGGEWQVFTKVLLPGSVPQVVTGVRLGVGRALLGVIVGEMYVATAGVGAQISLYGNAFRMAELIALVTLVSLFGFIVVDLIRRLEARLRHGQVEL